MRKYEVSMFNDVYFTKAKEASIADGLNSEVILQVFQKKTGLMAGGVFVKRLLSHVKGIELSLLPDGSVLEPNEPVMFLKGKFQDVVEHETTYLGYLAHCTKIATNVNELVKAAKNKPVLFFPARFSLPETQFYDGYAAGVGGAFGCSTETQAEGMKLWYDSFNTKTPKYSQHPLGTMSHAMIANFAGDTVRAALAVAKARPNEEQHVLVDFHNDCAKTAIDVFKAFKERGLKLHGIRLDTSEKLIDNGLLNSIPILPQSLEDHYYFYGVCPELVKHVRQELNAVGAKDVKITVSGGFNAAKVKQFEEKNVPVDIYAVGESFLSGSYPFTSDVVGIIEEDGCMTNVAKVGRGIKNAPRVLRVI